MMMGQNEAPSRPLNTDTTQTPNRLPAEMGRNAVHEASEDDTARELWMDDEVFSKETGKHDKQALPSDRENVYNDAEKAMPLSTYFNRSEPIYERARKVKPIDGYEDLFIHGDATGFSINNSNGEQSDVYTPREFAEILRSDPNYHGGDIRLCSCGTGTEGAIAAKALARQLGVNVLAPSDTLWIHYGGKMTIGADEFNDDGEGLLLKGR